MAGKMSLEPVTLYAYISIALDEQRPWLALPFAIIHRASERAVGSTRYGNIDTQNRRLEIGWTWVIPSFQRTAANTEAKLLLLTHAFEVLGMHRVGDTVYFSIIDTEWPAIKNRLTTTAASS